MASDLPKSERATVRSSPETNAGAEIAEPEFERIAATGEFKALVAKKKRFIFPVFACFFVYYFSLLFLVGHAPEWMKVRVAGSVNVGYLFGLSQFVVSWIIAYRYMKATNRFDALTKQILSNRQGTTEKEK